MLFDLAELALSLILSGTIFNVLVIYTSKNVSEHSMLSYLSRAFVITHLSFRVLTLRGKIFAEGK